MKSKFIFHASAHLKNPRKNNQWKLEAKDNDK